MVMKLVVFVRLYTWLHFSLPFDFCLLNKYYSVVVFKWHGK